jgi:hypothetical protein
MLGTPSRTQSSPPPPQARSKTISKTPRSPTICHHCHTVRKTYPRPTKLVHVFCCKNKGRNLIVTDDLQAILRDWSALICLVGKLSTHVAELIKHPPSYQGFVDASKWGVGGVWFSGTKQLIPIVWFYEWPQDIRDQFCSSSNKTGTLTISDLELTGILLHWLVLEHIVDIATLCDASVSIWCDNLPAVAWMYKFRTSTSLVAARILRALAVRLHTNRAALLSVEHIFGIYNKMADVASRRHSLTTQFSSPISLLCSHPHRANSGQCSYSATRLHQKSIRNCSKSNRLWSRGVDYHLLSKL